MQITTEMIKKLRQSTGSGVLDCRNALVQADGDFDKALDSLREKGLATASKRAGQQALEGVIELYSHANGRLGVMVEVNSETDFVGLSEDFHKFAHEIALQIAATSPLYINDEDIPEDILKHEEKIATARAREEGKPDKIIPRIVEGYIKKYKDENVLLRQPYIRDESITIQELLIQKIATLGENIVIRRFARFALGESSSDE
ncbi:MAG TPA: translation elongation factor Ts [Anaerolineae bacterium]|nr:translation elongation factor Ts [Anaerolineae bacterium]